MPDCRLKPFFLLNNVIELFLAGQLKFCCCFPFPFPRKTEGTTGCSDSDSCPGGCLAPYMPAPTARSCCYNKEQGQMGEASFCKVWEVRAVPISKLNGKQQWKVFLKWVKVCMFLLSRKSDDGQRGPLLHPRRWHHSYIEEDTLDNKCGKSPLLKIYGKTKRVI